MNLTESKSQILHPPIIIVGAGRSGTNMLRDLLAQLPEFSTWPCDEINYIWRHGNRGFETDEFTREMADWKKPARIRCVAVLSIKFFPGHVSFTSFAMVETWLRRRRCDGMQN